MLKTIRLHIYTSKYLYLIRKPFLQSMRRIVLILFLVFLHLLLNAQVKEIGLPYIKNYTKIEYQSGTQNWDIDQDKNGNVYFANNNGLLQFDGSTWKTYTIQSSSNIRSVKVDSITNRVYIGAYNDFGYFESDEKGELTYVSLIDKIPDEKFKTSDYIWKIHLFKGEVIFQSFGSAYIFKNDTIQILPASGKFQFSFKVNDHLYFQDTTKGLLEYNNGSLTLLEGTEIFNSSEIWGVFSLEKNIIITTLEAGLFIYENGKIQPWNTEANQFIKNNSSLGGITINNDLIVLNSVLGGIIICNKEGKVLQHIDLEKGLKNNTVLSSFIDNNNNLWLGLDNGISYLNINSPFSYFSSSLHLSSVYATTLYKDVLYVATNQGVFYNKLNREFKDGSFNLVEGTSSQSWNIQVIAGELICANNKGVLVIKDNKVDRVLDQEGYFGLKEIPSHPNYFVGANYGGFAIFEKTFKGLIFRNRVEGLYKSSKDFELDDNYMWLKRDQFLYQLEFTSDLQSFIIKNKIVNINDTPGGVTTLQKINNKLYFISNNHFYTYSSEFDVFQEDVHMSNLFLKVPLINSIVQDSHNNLWYTYNQSESLGVLKKIGINDYKNSIQPFSNLTGNFVTNYLSINYIDNYNVFIGLINGLAHYNPDFTSSYTNKPKVFIRSFSYENDTIIQGNPQQKDITIKLPYKYNNVRFTFSSPEFENNNNIQYSYLLEPFDKQWSNWSKEAIKEYTNLGESNYTMKVKVKNSHGIESDQTTFTFSISPPWYRHYLAYLGYFLLMLLATHLIRMRIKAKIRKNKYYETMEQRKIYLEKESKIKREQYQLEKKIEKLNRDKLKTKILAKDKELVSNSLQVVKKNKVLNSIVHKLKEMDTNTMNEDAKLQLKILKNSVIKEINNNSWKDLEKHIKNVHFEFLKRLKEKYPNISQRELDLSTYLLMNMSTKEIAEVMNISNGGVELARYRLRKKLGLKRKDNLTGFLMNI